MKYFEYTARNDITGKTISGIMTGDSQASATITLVKKNLVVVNIEPMKDFLNIRKTLYNIQNNIKKKNIKDFLDQLSFMLDTNLQVYSALLILRDSSIDKKLRTIAVPIAENIRKGTPLHEAMEKSGYFEKSAVMQIKSGEESGSVPDALSRLVIQYERDIDFSTKIKNAMTYPILIVTVMTVVLWVLMTMVVPTISKTLISLGGELPAITKIVIAVSNFMSSTSIHVILCAVGLVFYYKYKVKTDEKFAVKADSIKLKIPILGKVILKIEMSRFCRNLSAIQNSGISLVPSLNVTYSAMKNEYLKKAVKKSAKMIEISGMNLSSALTQTGVFPNLMIQLIEVGVNAGKITNILDKIAIQYEKEIDNSIKKITGLMEPIMIVVVGLIAGTVVVSMFLPMLSIMGNLGA